MPKRLPVKSLKAITEENIVKNVDSFWCVKYLKDWGDKHLLFVEGPFDCLGPMTCHRILSELARKKVLKRHHIYLLINPYLESLDLSCILDGSKIKLILELALTRCIRLTKLIYTTGKDLSSIFMSHLEIFNSIVDLNLSFCRLRDRDVSLLGIHGPNIRKLKLINNMFGDNGIKSLFMPLDHNGKEDHSYGQCQKVEILDFRENDVSIGAIAELYFLLQEKLLVIRTSHSLEVIQHCLSHATKDLTQYKTDWIEYTLPTGNELPIPVLPYMVAALSVAPKASKFNLLEIQPNLESDGSGISLIKDFEKVTELILQMNTFSFEQEFVFDRGLTPIFLSHGCNLTRIDLCFVQDIDLALLCSSCTVLEDLTLQYNGFSNALSDCSIVSDWPLRKLVIQCMPSKFPLEPVLESLLIGAQRLEIFLLGYCPSFTDELIARVSNLNAFDYLNDMSLTNIPFITMRALEESLLKKTNIPLRHLCLFSCQLITKADMQNYEKFLEQNHYCVDLFWE